MNFPSQTYSVALRRYIVVLLAATVFLIWWGAATTTEGAGMAFADWPLSHGSINPEGWLKYLAPFLEHTHRLFANLVGFLTLGLLIWTYGSTSKKRGLEVLGIFLLLTLIFGIFIASGRERFSAERKQMLLLIGVISSLIPIGWLIVSWFRRGWSLIQKIAGLAFLMVTAQAIFGGLRVTEISDSWAVFHGCFAQAFFCVLILIAIVASPNWEGIRPVVAHRSRSALMSFATISVSVVVTQLALGALMRHHHRFGLADSGIVKTGGELVPAFDHPIITIMFFHKVTALAIFLLAFVFFGWLVRQKNMDVRFVRFQSIVAGLLVAQVTLGVLVIVTEKSFWITNFHVLNGLAILACAFSILVWAIRSKNEVLIAADSR
ncbi:COX15/CtaA family protein [Verrucomicrobiales bacterium]|jgi:cytochrome c oxidase assembly protein subunit 15|nr:COX15/CtaA family protein [Verrucomicrobiales bacterium]